ncbi:MAG: hypothetical protein AVDCRST_MAG95-870 [uncultured Adhaeribacter sp.]|uniref:Uncharacterized protein n=1 Tax=uncultured Adhaeribacter sp. TaxID=448109 RepID=A0A6J4HLI8_9BACT|nr:MAG: hypothetical protein AVDCRST_MAG95-870 [uncultured Adhaeribacter sp.]
MIKYIGVILLAGLLLNGCTDEISPTPDALGSKYYPLRVGAYWIYQVTETRYKNQPATTPGDSVAYFIKEQIDTIYQDLTGQDTYQYTRSRRNMLTDDWGSDTMFAVNKSATDVRVQRNNRRQVTFIFPVSNGRKWNPDIFNTNSQVFNKPEEKFYYFGEVGQPFSVNDTTYQNTVKVIQQQIENAIERQNQFEIYAYGVGRVFKQFLRFDYCSDPDRQNGCQVGQGYIITGLKRTEKLINYGTAK